MKFPNKMKQINIKLIFSYTLLLVTTITLLGTTGVIYFTNALNSQIRESNDKVLTSLKRHIETTVLDEVDSVYLTLFAKSITDKEYIEFFNHDSLNDYINAYEISNQLREGILAYSDTIESVSIYYKNSDTVISSKGILYSNEALYRTYEPEWLDMVKSSDKIALCYPTRKCSDYSGYSNYTDINVCSIIKAYPFVNDTDKIKGYVSFDIADSAFERVLSQSDGDIVGDIYLVDEDGNLLYSVNETAYPATLYDVNPSLVGLFDSGSLDGSAVRGKGADKRFVSYTTFDNCGWRLVVSSDVQILYDVTKNIRYVVLIACFVVLVIGLLMASIFTSKMYNPIKRLLGIINAKNKYNEPDDDNYYIIENLINSLSSQETDIENMIEANIPVIKHNMLVNLFCGIINSEDEVRELLSIIQYKLLDGHYSAIILSPDKELLRSFDLNQNRLFYYGFIEEIEKTSDANAAFLCAELPDNRIGIFANFNTNDIKYVSDVVIATVERLLPDFNMKMSISCGLPVADFKSVRDSFASADRALKYKFFFPEKRILFAGDFLEKEASENTVPANQNEALAATFKNGNTDNLKKHINEYIEYLKNGNFSVDQCNFALLDLMNIISNYVKELGINMQDTSEDYFVESFSNIKNIYQFERWILDVSYLVAEKKQLINKSSKTYVVEQIKGFINNNLNNELSLSKIADEMYMSTSHLSRLFKEQMGISFSEYVAQVRLERVRMLLINSEMSIEHIAKETGYNTTHYLIKKFKERYGLTPKAYRTNKQTETGN